MTTADKLSTSIMNALCNNIIVQMYCIKTNPRIEKKKPSILDFRTLHSNRDEVSIIQDDH